MVTKWKNRWVLLVWLLLFSHGLSGIMNGLLHGRDYIQKDYFETPLFENQLHQFIHTLNLFELNYIPKEEAKKLITVSNEEINEHRNRYGNLSQQVSNLKAQYEGKIQEALANKNQEVANVYMAERDKKIEDITKNFQSEDYVHAKVVKEKEQKIDDYYRQIENERTDFIRYKGIFQYQLRDTETGKVYANGTNDQVLNQKDMAFVRSYPSSTYGPLSVGESSNLEVLIMKKPSIFEGQIAVPKSVIAAGSVLPDFNEFQHKQKVFYLHTISGTAAFLLSLFLLKRYPILQMIAPMGWQAYYGRVPSDIRAAFLAFSGLITLLMLGRDHVYLYDYFIEWLFDLTMTALFIAITLIQATFLIAQFKEGINLQAEWKKSVLYKIYIGVTEVFLIRRIGTQVFILIMMSFIFGIGFAIVLSHPRLLPLYAIGFVLVGLPVLIFVVKRTGYLNRVMMHTSQLASGNLEPDLPITGNSAFATLAANVNMLKHGVKTSQRAQAKSERFKTELITNVSHDLRTPLTSIISYTELLKTPDLGDDERNSYIEIIDRKSKRLKVLIDDLFEASKMASGSVELLMEKVDVVQLLQQALAEYNDQMNESTLQFRVTTPETPIYSLVDGQKLWRVFDNLIGNILKYSLENTRVYISVKTIPNQVVMTFKNVTKYELGESVEELFERFKRGDTSRHTEGSGLGLAIAKSIVDLHEGSLDIDVDGDLFKVTLLLDSI